MLCMISYSRCPQSGFITCCLNQTCHALRTRGWHFLDKLPQRRVRILQAGEGVHPEPLSHL